jgi:DNA-binding NarL/FixJ family response regulator
MDNQPHLLIVGDNRFFNEAIGDMVKAQQNLQSVAITTPDGLSKTCSGGAFDLVLIDAEIHFPPLVDTIRKVRALFVEPKIIVLGVDQNDLLEIIEAGAQGYVFKEQPFTEVVKTIEAVQRKEVVCSSQIARSVLTRVSTLSRMREGRNEKLTPREMEILDSIAAGLSNKDISRQLRITLPTVKNHVHNILTKLEVHRRQDAIQFALRKPSIGFLIRNTLYSLLLCIELCLRYLEIGRAVLSG